MEKKEKERLLKRRRRHEDERRNGDAQISDGGGLDDDTVANANGEKMVLVKKTKMQRTKEHKTTKTAKK